MTEFKDVKTGTTKICPTCKTEIPVGAKKCPHCHSDLRSWFRRHPILTFLLILFGLPFVMVLVGIGGGSSPSSTTKVEQSTAVKEAEDKEFLKKVDKLRAEMTGNISKEVENGGIFTKSYTERSGDDLSLELTVSDGWYSLAEFQRDRLLKDAWTYFNLLGAKYGLREEDSLPWKVTLVDRYGERVAEQGWW